MRRSLTLIQRKKTLYADRKNRPHPPEILPGNVPDDKRALSQWVGWRFEWRADRGGGRRVE